MKNDNIFSQIAALNNLEFAWNDIKLKQRSSGIDNISAAEFDKNMNENILQISQSLKNGKYIPKPVYEFEKIKDQKKRINLVITAISDKIIQKSCANLIEPILEKKFYQFSYAFRKKRGHRNAIELISKLFNSHKFSYVATGDIHHYFDNINQELLISKIKAEISDDEQFINLIRLWLQNESISKNKKFKQRNKGIYKGYIISPMLSNLYLNDFDSHWDNKDYLYLRYADNFIFLTNEEKKAEQLYREAEKYLKEILNLNLNEKDYQLANIENGFSFLGILFKNQILTISAEKFTKAKKKIRRIINSNNNNINKITKELNLSIASWQYYYSLINEQKMKLKFNNYIIHQIIKKATELKLSKDESLKLINKVLLFYKYSAKEKTDIALEYYNNIKNQKVDTKALIRKNRKFYKKDMNLKGEWLILKPGTKMRLSSNMIVLESQNYKTQTSLNKVSSIQINVQNNSITTNLIGKLSQKKIPVYITDNFGKPIASIIPAIYSSLGKSRKQIEAFYNGKAIYLSKEFVIGKIQNQQKLLTYYAKYWRKKSPRFKELFDDFKIKSNQTIARIENLKAPTIKDLQSKILGEEGNIAVRYWKIFAFLVLPEEFKRNKHGNDKINIMLNYGYGFLYNRIHSMILKMGLNPQISYLHREQMNKPTLTFDIIEQFRASVVERTVISIVNKKQEINFNKKTKRLDEESRKVLAKAFLNRLHSYFNYKKTETSFAEQIDQRVKDLEQFLTSEKKEVSPYKSFIMKS